MKKDFKEFIFDSLDKILKTSDFGAWRAQVNFKEEYRKNGEEIEFEIDCDPEYQQFTLDVYKIVKDYFEAGRFERIYEGLCHEVGHLHTAVLYELTEQPYKSEDEVTRANEQLATKIGYYLYKLSTGEKSKCQQHSARRRSTTTKRKKR
jgi:hypothetical protein